MSRFIVLLLLCVLLPNQVLSQTTEPSAGTLLFREGDVSVHLRETELRIQWRDHSHVLLRRRPGTLEIRRVHVDSQTDALDLWDPDARYPLLILSDARITEVWPAAGGETVDIRGPRIFPGDGTVHVRDRVTRLCHPRRRDLIRTRRASSTRLSLAQIERQASSWTQHRTREFVVRVEGNRLAPTPPAERFFYPGFWSRCESTSPEETTDETAQRTEQSITFEEPGERVYEDTALGVEIDQHGDPEGRTLRVRWQGKAGFVRTGERVWPADETTVRQVMLRRGVPALLVSGEWYAGEDWSYHQNFLFLADERTADGGLRSVQDSSSTHFTESYDHSVRFAGDGTVRISRLATRECRPSEASLRRWRRNYPGMTASESAREADSWIQRRTVERILEVREGRFVHAVPRWRTNSRWGSCEGEIFAACPFVDVLGPHGSTRVGEILRSIEYAPATQSLALPLATLPAHGEVLSIRISEEKAEVTFLDEIHIEIDGVFVRPHVCTESTSAPAFCQADENYTILRNGEDLVLHFSLPESSSAPEVVAHGYYEPEANNTTAHHHR